MKTLFTLCLFFASFISRSQSINAIGNLSVQPIDSCTTADCGNDVIQELRLVPNYTKGDINTIFTLSQFAYLTTRVYNIADGQQIYTLFQGNMDPGTYNLNYQLPNMPDGTYELVMETDRDMKRERFVLQR